MSKSYMVVDESGCQAKRPHVIPTKLNPEQRLSMEDVVWTKKAVESFVMKFGEASAEVRREKSSDIPLYGIKIIGPLDDFKALEQMIYKEIGMRELQPFPTVIYDLRGICAKIRWFFGRKIGTQDLVPIELPVSDQSA